MRIIKNHLSQTSPFTDHLPRPSSSSPSPSILISYRPPSSSHFFFSSCSESHFLRREVKLMAFLLFCAKFRSAFDVDCIFCASISGKLLRRSYSHCCRPRHGPRYGEWMRARVRAQIRPQLVVDAARCLIKNLVCAADALPAICTAAFSSSPCPLLHSLSVSATKQLKTTTNLAKQFPKISGHSIEAKHNLRKVQICVYS